MENYFLKPSPKTPKLDFNYQTGIFEISGKSIPENSIEFYKPLVYWLDAYVQNPKEVTTLVVKLEYFNTSSSKCLVEVFRKLEKIQTVGQSISILWYYEEMDEDMLESGEDFKEIIKVPIELLMIEQES